MYVFVTSSKGKNSPFKKATEIVSSFLQKGDHILLLATRKKPASRLDIIQKAELIIVLPGDMTTLYDLYVSIETKRRGEHHSRILVANIKGFFDQALLNIDQTIELGFTERTEQDLYEIVSTFDELKEYLERIEKNK